MSSLSEEQFLVLYDQYVGKIYRYIYFRVNAEEQAQDLTSEVFLKSWQWLSDSSPKFKTRDLANPRAFFYQVARNLITDFYSQKDRLPLSLDEITDRPLADKTVGPSEQASLNLDMATVKKTLQKLNPDYQEIIIWRYLDELEVKEIAQIIDKSEGAVRTILSRALASLKEVLR